MRLENMPPQEENPKKYLFEMLIGETQGKNEIFNFYAIFVLIKLLTHGRNFYSIKIKDLIYFF